MPGADLGDDRLDAAPLLVALAVHLLGAGQQRLDLAEVDEDVVAVAGLLDDAGDDLGHAVDVLLVHHLALRLADPLQDDLLRGLRGDAAEVVRGDVGALDLLRRHLRPVDVEVLVVDERVRVLAVLGLERLELGDRALAGLLDQRLLDVGRELDRVDAEVTLVVELDRRVAGRARSLLVGGEQRVLERGDERRAVDSLLLLDDVNGFDDLAGHPVPSSSTFPRTIASYGISTGSSLSAATSRSERSPTATSSPRKLLPPGDRRGGAQGDLAADRALEVRAPPKRRLGAGRGDVDRVLVEVAAQRVRHALAERVVDALRMVDEDGEALRAGELDGQHLDSGQAALDPRGDLAVEAPLLVVDVRQSDSPQKKRARRAHFKPLRNVVRQG